MSGSQLTSKRAGSRPLRKSSPQATGLGFLWLSRAPCAPDSPCRSLAIHQIAVPLQRSILVSLLSLLGCRSPQLELHSKAAPAYLCLSVEGGAKAVLAGKLINGTLVTSIPCGEASFWDIAEGSGSVIVSGTDFALDIGLEPANHGGLKIWKSFPTAPQQTWYLTPDHRIAQTGGDQCIDQGEDRAQTYQCTAGNTNQVWNVAFAVPLPTVTTVVANSTRPAYTLISGSYGPGSTLVAGTVVPIPSIVVSSHGPVATVSASSAGPAQTVISGSYADPAVTGGNTLASGSSNVGVAYTVISGSYANPAATGNALGSGSSYVGPAPTLVSGSYAAAAAATTTA